MTAENIQMKFNITRHGLLSIIFFMCISCNRSEESSNNDLKDNLQLKLLLTKELATIYNKHQTPRQQLMMVINKHGVDSKQAKNLGSVIQTDDFINLTKVRSIIDKYG
jgi:6-phosphogluconate dehydrogenase